MAILIIFKFTDYVNLKKTVLESSGSCSVPTLILFRKQLKWDKSIYKYFNNKHINKPIKYELLTFENMFNFHYIKQDNQKHFQKKIKSIHFCGTSQQLKKSYLWHHNYYYIFCGLTEFQTLKSVIYFHLREYFLYSTLLLQYRFSYDYFKFRMGPFVWTNLKPSRST